MMGPAHEGGDEMIGGFRRRVREAETQVLGLFADDDALSRARRWAREVLRDRHVDPARSPLRAARALCAADRRLRLSSARWLIAHLEAGPAQHPPRRPPQLR
jgi:hypothetical protein